MFNQRIFLRVKHNYFLNDLFVKCIHIYKPPAITLSQLENHLITSAVYDDGLLIVNKPIGISYEKGLVDSDSLNSGKDVCIKSALPALKEHFKVDKLFNVKIPERNISGVTIFSESEGLMNEVLKWWKVMRGYKEKMDIYHAVVVGQPFKDHGHFDGAIALKTKNGIKRIVLSEDVGQNAVKRGEEKRVVFSYETLATGSSASLLEVQASRAKWNSVRAFLATHILTPVLGDALFGMYVKTLLGTPVPVDIFSKSLLPSQKLPELLKKQLDISTRTDVSVPLHLHLSTVKLMRKKHRVTEYSVPYPETFQWTLGCLGLSKELLTLTSATA